MRTHTPTLILVSALIACSRTPLDIATTRVVNDADGGDGGDPSFGTGACSSWNIATPNVIAPPNDVSAMLWDAMTAGQGALVGWEADSPFGLQLVHVNVHGTIDETPPPVIKAPYQQTQFQIAFALAGSHGHGGVGRYESPFGWAFTPIDLHGVATGPEIQVGSDPNDGFAHGLGLYSTPNGFLEMDTEGGNSTAAELLDFTGAVQAHVTPLSALPSPVWSDATVLDDGTIIGVGAQSSAPAVTDQAEDETGTLIGSLHVLDPNAETLQPSLFTATVGGAAIVTIGDVGAGMSVVQLQGDGAPPGPPATFNPPDGSCATVAYAHGAIVCVTASGQALHVQAFGYDGSARSAILTAMLPATDAPIFSTTPVAVATATGALAFVNPIISGNAVTFSVEVSCVP